MRFGNLHFLWFLGLIPAAVVFYIWAFKHKNYLIDTFLDPEIKNRLLVGVSAKRQKFKALLLVLVITFSVIALIRPKWGFHWEEVSRRGVDIMIALDVSKSMLAQDVTPNRLERAKREIIDLLNIVQGDRIGLIAFAGTAFLQSPLTLDYGAVQIFLDDIDTDIIPIPGTAMDEAIDKATASFDQQDKKARVLIMITDGEDQNGGAIAAAEKASKQNIKIYTIGIGKEGGAPIPESGEKDSKDGRDAREGEDLLGNGGNSGGSRGGFKKNSKGELILTHLDEETLQKVALKTGGSYVRSVTGDFHLDQIYKDIRKTVEEKELKSGKQKRFEERFQWPLFLAIFLLVFESLFPERRPKREGKSTLSRFFSILLLVATFGLVFPFQSNWAGTFTTKAEDGVSAYQKGQYDKALQGLIDSQIENPKDENIKFNLASTYYKMKDYEKANELFQSLAASGNTDLSQKSFYNLGNTAYQEGKLQEAVDFYKKALDLNAKDEDAKHNLEFVRKEIKRRIEEQRKQQQNQQNKNQQQQPNQQNQQDQNQQKQQGKEDQQKQDQKQQGKEGQQDQKDQQKSDQDKSKEGNQGKSGEQGKEKEAEAEKNKEKEKQAQQGGKNDQDKKPEDEGKDKEKEKEQKGQAAQQAEENQDKSDPGKDQKGSSAKAFKKGDKNDKDKEMSEEEATSWLSTIEENKKKFLRNAAQPNRTYRVEKDW